MLVANLPPRGPLYRQLHGHTWHDIEHLLAQLLDDVRRIPTAIFRAQGGKANDPKPIKRPGEKPQRQLGDRGDHSVAEVVAYLDNLSAKGAPA